MRRKNHLSKWLISNGVLAIAIACLSGCKTGELNKPATTAE